MRRALAAAAGVAVGLAVPASAYRLAYSDKGVALKWPTACVVYHVNQRGSDDIVTEKVVHAVQKAFQTWNDVEDSYVRAIYGGLTDLEGLGLSSERNVLVWRERPEDWTSVPNEVRGVTTITYDAVTSTIVDVDIELNGAFFEFTTEDDEPIVNDIQAMVTHEAGHLFGIDHSEEPLAVMNPYFIEGSLAKRLLDKDDARALWKSYATAADPGECAGDLVGDFYTVYPNPVGGGPSGTTGCTAAASSSALGQGVASVLLAALLLLLLLRRREGPEPAASSPAVRGRRVLGLRMSAPGADPPYPPLRPGLVALACAAILLPAAARGYELYKTCPVEDVECVMDPNLEIPLHWRSHDALVVIDAGQPQEIAAAEAEHVIVASFQTWSDLSCDGKPVPFDWVYGGLVSGKAVGYLDDGSNENLVIWIRKSSDWKHKGDVLALTSLTYDTKTGEIVDADLELNDAHFDWSLSPDDGEVDLKNTVVHEAGHCLGLDHTDVAKATMYSKAPLGETSKRDLAADDIAGYCAIYETLPEAGAEDVQWDATAQRWIVVPRPNPKTGCQGSPGASPRALPAVWLLLLALLGLAGRRRVRDTTHLR